MFYQEVAIVAKTILKKRDKAEGITLSDFRQYYKAIVIKRALAQKQMYGPLEQNREPRNKENMVN